MAPKFASCNRARDLQRNPHFNFNLIGIAERQTESSSQYLGGVTAIANYGYYSDKEGHLPSDLSISNALKVFSIPFLTEIEG